MALAVVLPDIETYNKAVQLMHQVPDYCMPAAAAPET